MHPWASLKTVPWNTDGRNEHINKQQFFFFHFKYKYHHQITNVKGTLKPKCHIFEKSRADNSRTLHGRVICYSIKFHLSVSQNYHRYTIELCFMIIQGQISQNLVTPGIYMYFFTKAYPSNSLCILVKFYQLSYQRNSWKCKFLTTNEQITQELHTMQSYNSLPKHDLSATLFICEVWLNFFFQNYRSFCRKPIFLIVQGQINHKLGTAKFRDR